MASSKQSHQCAAAFYDASVYGERLARVRDNTVRMLERRGYDSRTFAYEKPDGADAKRGIALRVRGDVARVLVVFVQNSKVNIELVKHVIESNNRPGCCAFKRLLIVYDTAVTPDAARAISEESVADFAIESFTYQYMMIDPTEFVPAHSRLSPTERPKNWTKLPKIHESDVIARYYGFRKNDVVRIDDGVEITYRACV